MKKIILFIAVLLAYNTSIAQITIQSTDIGETNDTVRYSYSLMPIADIVATGVDHVWDFTPMVAVSQTTNGFVAYYNIGDMYKYAFVGKADFAESRPDMALPGVNITESYSFYKKTSKVFKSVGNGGKVNGITLPMVYDSPDVIYEFPMNYGDQYSSDSHYKRSMPIIGYIEQDLHRVNNVDGWGTIKTPHGNYQCLRIKSIVTQSDSVFISYSGAGMRVPQVYTKYIWLAKSMNFPVVTALVSPRGAYIKYMDSYIPFTAINTSKGAKVKMGIQPNPAINNVFITLTTNDRSDLIISDITGKEILKKSFTNNINIDISGFAKGVYIINILNDQKNYSEKLIVK